MHNGLARFTDPTSPVFGAASAAAFGALSLVDPARLSPARRQAYRAGLAATTSWWAAVTTDRERTMFVPANVVAGLLAGGSVWALAEASEALDDRVVNKLHAAGVRHPRPWLAAVSVASVLVTFAVDRAAARTEPQMWLEELMRTRPVTPEVREVVRGILQATDTPDSQVLLAQLAVAQESYFDDGDGDGDGGVSTTVEFEVPEEVARVVPHFQIYPVQARFQASEGTELQVSLQLHQGKLANVAIEAVDEDHTEAVDEIVDRWPEPASLHYVRDGTDGSGLPLI